MIYLPGNWYIQFYNKFVERDNNVNAQDLLRLALEHEKTYQFPSFERDDVWELGCDLVESCKEYDGPLAVEIDISGVMVFRYYPSGTGAFHEMWLERKRKTVNLLEKSSLRVSAELKTTGQTLEKDMLLNPMEYADCGGGFPLRIKNGCIFGFVGVSGLADMVEHAALIGGLQRFFRRHGYL